MTPFALLTNKRRDAQRPPRLVSRANAAWIARLVPVRMQRRKPEPAGKTAGLVPGTLPHARNGQKLPQPQAPVIVHFPTMPARTVEPVRNGNTKFKLHKKLVDETEPGTKTTSPDPLVERSGQPVSFWDAYQAEHAFQSSQDTSQSLTRISDPFQESNENKPATKLEDRIPETQPVPISPRLSLKEVLARNQSLPPQSVVLGVCEDGLPIALDLNDPAPGSLLVLGDRREDQIALLQMAVASLGLRNSPRAIQFAIFSHQPENWLAWVNQHGFARHCISIENSQENTLRDRVIQLADWTEQRLIGQRSGPPVLLVIDTLTFLPRLEYDVRLNFDWLVKEGPPARIWTIAAISTDLATSLGSRMLRSFQSRIFGWAREPGFYQRFFEVAENTAGDMDQPGLFAVQAGGSWLRFHLAGDGI